MPPCEPQTICFDLPSVLDVLAVQDLRERWDPLIGPNVAFRLNASSIERVGTQAVQFLVAAARALESVGSQLTIEQPSRCLTDAFTDLGLPSELATRSQA